MIQFFNMFNIIHISINSEHFIVTTPEQHVSHLSVTFKWKILYTISIYTKQPMTSTTWQSQNLPTKINPNNNSITHLKNIYVCVIHTHQLMEH